MSKITRWSIGRIFYIIHIIYMYEMFCFGVNKCNDIPMIILFHEIAFMYYAKKVNLSVTTFFNM